MNKTQRSLIRLREYILDNFAIDKSEFTQITEHLRVYRGSDETKFMSFKFYDIGVTAARGHFELELPDHIDINDFEMYRLLKDMWDVVTEKVAKKNKNSQPAKSADAFTGEIFELIEKHTGVTKDHIKNIDIQVESDIPVELK